MPENTIRDPNNVLPVFVSNVVGIGTMNGVLNISFSTLLFSAQGEEIVPDPVVSCRLRMDMACAAQVYDQLSKLFAPKDDTETEH